MGFIYSNYTLMVDNLFDWIVTCVNNSYYNSINQPNLVKETIEYQLSLGIL